MGLPLFLHPCEADANSSNERAVYVHSKCTCVTEHPQLPLKSEVEKDAQHFALKVVPEQPTLHGAPSPRAAPQCHW